MYLYSAVQICEYLYKYSVAHVFFFLWRSYFCGARQLDAPLKYFYGARRRVHHRILVFFWRTVGVRHKKIF